MAGEISNETVHERYQKKNVRGTTHRLEPIFLFVFGAPRVTSRIRDLFSPPLFLSLCLSLSAPSHSHHMEEKIPRHHRDVANKGEKGKRKEKIQGNHRTNARKRESKEKEKEKKRKEKKTKNKKRHETTGATQRYNPPHTHTHHTTPHTPIPSHLPIVLLCLRAKAAPQDEACSEARKVSMNEACVTSSSKV